MKKIAVLTYNKKHRKTFDALCLLRAKGYDHVTVYAQPMTYVKKGYPLIEHRPGLVMDIPEPDQLCRNFGYEYLEGEFAVTAESAGRDVLFLLCGAGLLQEPFVKKHRIVNSHPGYSPFARGLDSYKWSVYYNLPIGVTTHVIGEYVDAGEIIERREIGVNWQDMFHSVAQRIYENEIDMLVGAVEHMDEKHEYIIPKNEIFKRMPAKIEENLPDKFQQYKKMKLESLV